MIIDLIRYSDKNGSTLGLFLIDQLFECYSLEDEYRAVKVAGETRIPAGIYEVGYRKEESPMTLSYRKKYSWFTWHLEIKDVPNFKYVYIHIGNKDTDTDACVLVADQANNNTIGDGFIGSSGPAFKRVYEKVCNALDAGEKVFMSVKDKVV